MNTRRATRSQLFDSLEDGGLRSSAPYASTAEIAEQENDRSLGELHDRVNILKRLTGDIHEEVESHNKLLEGMGNAMDVSRSLMAGTMDRFTRAFETKSSRNLATIVVSCVVIFLLVYYLTKS
ncbi:bet1-like SNARE 1-1 isoform X2 [Physcomitrium patens]|uniref:t-SNARE coiled-coil homology domain-containing protein n=1 Tax=Physcomitrium patens TaxID=3218 RepID=A0A2K1J319_PHYPA|nr:bet1-like SNARE 1-1 isoform X2 [Physcomitrium patens]PNR35922.1 hypothetical protein PHYPA_021772 [Physcomitrium patens]|eukprot:XP_024401146.1 bet1-like SNARE 1-1 isoform X2 [Physcomitrella patens]